MSLSKKIKMLMVERDITQAELAKKLNTPQSNLSKKMKLDDWRESDLKDIANALDATYEYNFILNESNRKI